MLDDAAKKLKKLLPIDANQTLLLICHSSSLFADAKKRPYLKGGR
jgi:hypothetical protein